MVTALLTTPSGFAGRDGSHDRLPANAELQLSAVWAAVLDHPLRRILAWRIPPHWTVRDWSEEMRAHGAAAAWQAVCEYDPARGVPWEVFVRQRVLTSALTRFRDEWRYVVRCVRDLVGDGCGEHAEEDQTDSILRRHGLYRALARLSSPDRALVEQLFWKGKTEAEIAASLGISQPAVSKRKHAVLRKLLSALA